MPDARHRLQRWLAPLLVVAAGCSTFRPPDGPRLDPPTLPVRAQPPAPPGPLAALKAARRVPPTPGKSAVRLSQYVFYSDFELDRTSPIFAELAELRDQVFRELALPPGNTVVQVFLFEDFDKYKDYMQARYPDLPRRRAFFISQPRASGGADDLLVYTYWGDHIRQDLRHELTHAVLHSVLREVPLWLDEGLAEYFELPPTSNGVNRLHADELRKSLEPADMARLEALTQVDQMRQAEYREAWAWVHLMLRGAPEARRVLLGYLAQLRTNPNPGPLAPRLAGVFADPPAALGAHLAKLPSFVELTLPPPIAAAGGAGD